MSLLNFFAQQRKRWQSQPADDKPDDYLAGGLAAFDQAEAAFKSTPLYNAHQQAADAQRELEEMSYQLSLARKEIKSLKSKLASMTQQASEAAMTHQLTSVVKLQRKRGEIARRAMRRIVAAASDVATHPEARLRKIVEIVTRFRAAHEMGVWKEDGE